MGCQIYQKRSTILFLQHSRALFKIAGSRLNVCQLSRWFIFLKIGRLFDSDTLKMAIYLLFRGARILDKMPLLVGTAMHISTVPTYIGRHIVRF